MPVFIEPEANFLVSAATVYNLLIDNFDISGMFCSYSTIQI